MIIRLFRFCIFSQVNFILCNAWNFIYFFKFIGVTFFILPSYFFGGGGLVAQSCLTLCDPMDCSPSGSSVHGILQARRVEWSAFPFPPYFLMPEKLCPVFYSLILHIWLFSFFRSMVFLFLGCRGREVSLPRHFQILLCFQRTMFWIN